MPRTSFLLSALAILSSLSPAGALGCSSGSGKGNSDVQSEADSGSSSGGPATDGSAAEGDGGEGGVDCDEDASTADLTTPTVSFMSDVLPIFAQSCGVGGPTCHGSPPVGDAAAQGELGLYLANPLSDDAGLGDPATIIAGIVGVKSTEDPSMNIVTAGDPAQSYLQHKINGCLSGLACVANPLVTSGGACGLQMPWNDPPIDTSDNQTIERWIVQGAQNN